MSVLELAVSGAALFFLVFLIGDTWAMRQERKRMESFCEWVRRGRKDA